MGVKDRSFIKRKRRSSKQKELDKKLTTSREMRQSKIINHYTSKGLVFASLGSYHLRRDSVTLKNIKERRYIMVLQLLNGKENFRLPLNFDKSSVSYVIKEYKI